MRRVFILFTVLICASLGFAQAPITYAHWSAKLEPADARAGESAQIIVTTKIDDGWHIYSIDSDKGPVATAFDLGASKGFKANGKPIQPEPERIIDPNFDNAKLGVYHGAAAFALPVQIDANAKGAQKTAISIKFQTCTDRQCAPPATIEIPVSYTVAPGAPRPDHTAAITTVPAQPAGYVAPKAGDATSSAKEKPANNAAVDVEAKKIQDAKNSGLFAYLWLAFGAGLLALLTPCVWPMIPITVSFFSKKSEGKQQTDFKSATAYCLGIIGTFTALGLLMTALFGATGIQRLAANPFVNLGLALLFIALAANLFGVYELALPAGMVNKASVASRKGGLIGPILMGLTFSLTTFTCTVPFVGSLLVAASAGEWIYPALGMLAFSTAFALPFFLLALFPQYLAKMPKSGGWLSTVKVTMGFLELAAALKFLSNSDLAWQKGILTREVFIGIWAIVASLSSLYLLGWIKFGKEESVPKVGPARAAIGVLMLGVAGYCLFGLTGRPLGNLSAFLPPDPYPGQESTRKQATNWVHDYKQGRAQAIAQNKMMFINFTGVQCTNCRWMEANMLPQPEVAKRINETVPIELYTDRETPGDRENQALQQRMIKSVLLPGYVIVDPKDERVIGFYPGLERDEQTFVAFLDKAKSSGAVASR